MLDQETFRSALRAPHLGRSFRFLHATDSTSDQARRDAMEGAPHGHLVAAEIQTAGRGRKGRAWTAPEGVNLSFSLLLRPKIPVSQVPSLTLCAAVGCRDAIADALGPAAEGIGIKWPNDLLHGGRKLCGILSEMSLTARGELDFAIVGIGLNVNLDPDALPPPLCDTATSLRRIAGHPLDRSLLLALLAKRLEDAFDLGFQGLADRYRQASCTLGTPVRAIMESEILEGTAVDLTPSGALVIRTDDGTARTVLAGDVEHLRAPS